MAEFIVAIELGSSKITGVAGRKNADGSIVVLSVVQEPAEACIQKGVVYNIDKTVQALSTIIKRMETQLKTKIVRVYVGVGGQSIRSVMNTIPKDFAEETAITQDMINELMDDNRNMEYPEQEILDAITQEYKVGKQYQLDPVGIPTKRIEGNFLNILWRKAFYRNINKCFEQAGIAIAEMFLAPLALADSVLTDNERRGGCVLVDLGADTTTVSVYYHNILRHLAVIPLGGRNITKDIASLQTEEQTAEDIKLKYGSAYTEVTDIDKTVSYPIDSQRTVSMEMLVNIVEARTQEIIENVWVQVPEEYKDKLLGGIILTGGGCNMRNIEKAFTVYTHVEKIRSAKTVSQTIKSSSALINKKDARMCTVLGLLAKGDSNCAGDPVDGSLFGAATPKPSLTTADLHSEPRPSQETTGKGIVKTEAEKAAEETRRKKQEEEEQKLIKQKEEEERQREEARKNSKLHKFFDSLKIFGKKMLAEDEDEK